MDYLTRHATSDHVKIVIANSDLSPYCELSAYEVIQSDEYQCYTVSKNELNVYEVFRPFNDMEFELRYKDADGKPHTMRDAEFYIGMETREFMYKSGQWAGKEEPMNVTIYVTRKTREELYGHE